MSKYLKQSGQQPFSPGYFFLLPLLLVLCWQWPAIAETRDEYAVKAAFILNFALLTEWPESTLLDPETEITLCVVGTGRLPGAFQAISGKKIGVKILKVVTIPPDATLPPCDIVFYRKNVSTEHLVRTLNAVRATPVLTIGESKKVTNLGGAMYFFTDRGKLRFAVNPRIIAAQKLKLSSRLLKIATLLENR